MNLELMLIGFLFFVVIVTNLGMMVAIIVRELKEKGGKDAKKGR